MTEHRSLFASTRTRVTLPSPVGVPAGLHAVLAQLPLAVVLVDDGGTIVLANARARALFGSALRDAARIETLGSVLRAQRADGSTLAPDEWAPARLAALDGEELRVGPDDTAARWLAVTASELPADAGAPGTILLTFTDAEPLKRLERLHAEALARAGEARAAEVAVLESITDAFFALDREWRYRYVNRRAAELFGRPVAELQGALMWEAFPQAKNAPLVRQLERAMAERVTLEGEEYSVASRTWVEYRIYPTPDGVAMLFRDVAARRRAAIAAELLADSGALLASTFDVRLVLERLAELLVPRFSSACALYLLEDAELRCVASAADDPETAEQLRAMREETPVSSVAFHPINEVVQTGEPLLAAPIGDALFARATTSVEGEEALRAAGWRSLMIVPLEARGRTVGAMSLGTIGARRLFDADDLAVAREVAQRAALVVDTARLFGEAERARERAEEANRAKAEFLATMSHELRTPLTAIRGFTELLIDGVAGPVTPMQLDHLERVNSASEHLLVLVEEVLSFARLQAGRAEVRLHETTAEVVADSALNLIRPQLDRKGLALRRTEPPAPVTLLTDADKVRQILVNLLSNAAKFTDEGYVALDIDADAEMVRFTVTDTGPGISADHLAVIFEPFRQGDQSLTRRVGGTGLGLAVVRRLARLLGGDARVESEPGAGATFTVELPRRLPIPRA